MKEELEQSNSRKAKAREKEAITNTPREKNNT